MTTWKTILVNCRLLHTVAAQSAGRLTRPIWGSFELATSLFLQENSEDCFWNKTERAWLRKTDRA